MKRFLMAACLTAGLFMAPALGNAGNIGVYCWQLAPYTDVVCFDIDSKGFSMSAIGWNHAAGAYKFPAYGGICVNDYMGLYLFGWTMGMANLEAGIDPGTLSGVWHDSYGDSGNFVFVGAGPQVEGVVEGIGPKFESR